MDSTLAEEDNYEGPTAKITNIVTTLNLQRLFNLTALNAIMPASEHRKTLFPAIDIHLKDGDILKTGLLFATGCETGPGMKSLDQARYITQQIRLYIERCITHNYTDLSCLQQDSLYAEPPAELIGMCNDEEEEERLIDRNSIIAFTCYSIVNVVVTVHLPHGIDMRKLRQKWEHQITYVPDQFPGANYAPDDKDDAVTTSPTGRTGTKASHKKKYKWRALIFESGSINIMGPKTVEIAQEAVYEMLEVTKGMERDNIAIHPNARFNARLDAYLSSMPDEIAMNPMTNMSSRAYKQFLTELSKITTDDNGDVNNTNTSTTTNTNQIQDQDEDENENENENENNMSSTLDDKDN